MIGFERQDAQFCLRGAQRNGGIPIEIDMSNLRVTANSDLDILDHARVLGRFSELDMVLVLVPNYRTLSIVDINIQSRDLQRAEYT